MEEKISFFDLDHTLLKINSSFLFGMYLYGGGVIPTKKMLRLLGYYIQYKFNFISPKCLNEKACRIFFSGQSIHEIEEHIEPFLDMCLDTFLYKPAMTKLVLASILGHYTVILSSSPDFLVEAIADRIGVNESASTLYAVNDEGQITHIESHMDGPTKALYVKSVREYLEIPIEDTIAYSDSYIDLPFLQAVGTPIGVNPDRKLRKYCKANNWEIL